MKEMKPLVIVPSAGFGRRVGSPEAKEMFLRSNGSRMIDKPLEVARLREWPVHIISRAEKKSLNEYLKGCVPRPTIQIITPTLDWPETILKSEPFWREWNLVFLPDMEFTPDSAVDEMAGLMNQIDLDLIVARHWVDRMVSWGSISQTGESVISKSGAKFEGNSTIEVVEKPKDEKSGWAWGLYAFRARAGRTLLEAQLASCRDHEARKLKLKAAFVDLTSFRDLTR